MPYVHIQITNEGTAPDQKATLIQGATDLLVRVLNKDPTTTFVVIEEVETDNWGIAGQTVTKLRREAAADAQETRLVENGRNAT
jgi:4-oxalocrotonate tautomerase